MSESNPPPKQPGVARSGGNAVMAFILGALVAFVGVLAWIVLGGEAETGASGAGDINVTVEESQDPGTQEEDAETGGGTDGTVEGAAGGQ